MSDATPAFRRTATGLTVAGAMPFAGLLAGMALLDPPTNLTANFWLMVYASVILSFLGGIRWGLALATQGAGAITLALSVLPALAGWVIVPYSILIQPIPSPEWFLVYAVLFAAQLAWDIRSASVPGWFKPVRLNVSLVVIACMLGGWAVRVFLS